MSRIDQVTVRTAPEQLASEAAGPSSVRPPAAPPGPIAPGATVGQALRALAAAQKSSKGAPAYSRFVNRPMGRVLAALAFRAGLTPNMVTAVSALFTFSGIAVIALVSPTVWTGVLVAACLVLGYGFDAADGQLARLRGGGSPEGEWLDHMVDSVKISSLHLAVAIGLYRFSDLGRGWLLVPLGFAVVAAVSFFGMILNDQLRRQFTARTGRPVARGGTSGLRSLLVLPTDYGLLCVVFLTWGAIRVFVPIYTVLFAASAGYLLLAAVKWFRDAANLVEQPDR